ncbi:MAG: hypothetical protein H7A47_16175 [Verrucomicrobiales bacterium]|nr:hypothetical protein [Verrucomicrobiales bacterium]
MTSLPLPARPTRRPAVTAWGALAFLKGVLLSGLVAGLANWGPETPPCPGGIIRWPREGGAVFGSHFATWDGAHYLLLSEVGYQDGMASCAFYPLYPLLVRASAPLFGGSHLVAGLALSNLFSLAAWGLLVHLVRRRWGPRAAFWTLAFLVAFPGSLFFQFIYTESLFLLLALGLWLGLEDRRHWLAAMCALLLPVCRGVGAFAVLPLAWNAWSRSWESGGRSQKAGNSHVGSMAGDERSTAAMPSGVSRRSARSAWVPWLLVGMPVLGWGVYLALMWHWTGNPFEGMEAQKYWGVHSIRNLWDVPKFVVGFFNPTEWHAFRGSLLDRCVFALVLYTLPVWWRLDKGLLVWTYWLAVLPAMSGTYTSFTRFAACAFPVFIGLGVGLSRREWRWLRYGLLAVFATLHVVLVWRYVNFRWAG